MSLLVLEQGAEWPSWATGIRMRAPNSAVEAQLDDESSAHFQDRVLGRMAEIRRKKLKLVAAGYACSLNGEERWAARSAICMRLLDQLDPDSRSELILAGGSWETSGTSGRERSRLIALWSELSALGTGKTVSIRFEDKAHESGIFRAAQRLHQQTALLPTDVDPTLEASPRELVRP